MNPYCNPLYASMTVSALLEAFLVYKNTGDIKLASEGKIRSRIEHFTEIMGDMSLSGLDRDVVKDYVNRMQNMPGNLYLMRRKYKISDTHKLIEMALADGQPVMSRDAIGRHIESLGSMLKWAKSERYLFDNPAENVLAQRRMMVREQDRRDLFTDDELVQIFSADWFKKGNKGDITGMNPGEAALTVSKDGGKVDAITASTITSRAFLNAVNAAYAAYAGQETADGTTGATQKNVEQPADTTVSEAVDTLGVK